MVTRTDFIAKLDEIESAFEAGCPNVEKRRLNVFKDKGVMVSGFLYNDNTELRTICYYDEPIITDGEEIEEDENGVQETTFHYEYKFVLPQFSATGKQIIRKIQNITALQTHFDWLNNRFGVEGPVVQEVAAPTSVVPENEIIPTSATDNDGLLNIFTELVNLNYSFVNSYEVINDNKIVINLTNGDKIDFKNIAEHINMDYAEVQITYASTGKHCIYSGNDFAEAITKLNIYLARRNTREQNN